LQGSKPDVVAPFVPVVVTTRIAVVIVLIVVPVDDEVEVLVEDVEVGVLDDDELPGCAELLEVVVPEVELEVDDDVV